MIQKRIYRSISFLALLAMSCSINEANAQETRKNRVASSFWNSYLIDYNFSETDAGFLEIGGRYNGAVNTIFNGGLFGKLSSFQTVFGYQKKLNEHWKIGGYERFNLLSNRLDLHTRIYTGHKGKIGELTFEKNLSVEYLSTGSDDNSATVENDLARLSLDFNLIKSFNVNSNRLDAIFSYRTFWFKELDSSFEIYSGRFIDRTRLRLMLKYYLLDKIAIETFYVHNSDYFLLSGIADERLNNVSSVFGLNVQFILGNEDGQKRMLIY